MDETTRLAQIHDWTELELLRKRRGNANVAIREMCEWIYEHTEGEFEDALCDELEKVRVALNGDYTPDDCDDDDIPF